MFREHSELALIGFTFLFLLSLFIIDGDIQYKAGEIRETVGALANNSIMNISYYYTNIDDEAVAGSTLLHTLGYWLAISSVVGFIAVLLGLRGGWIINE